MKLRTLAMAAAVTGLSSAAAQAATPDACAIEVEFASMCCGVDRGAYADLKTFLETNPLATETTDRAWGMEGEQTLCANTKNGADAEVLYGQIRARLPATANRGYIRISVNGKARVRIPATPRNKVGPKGPKG